MRQQKDKRWKVNTGEHRRPRTLAKQRTSKYQGINVKINYG